MITFEYRFDVIPGKSAAYETYLKGPGKDLWLKFHGLVTHVSDSLLVQVSDKKRK